MCCAGGHLQHPFSLPAGLQFPIDGSVEAAQFKEIYSHPSANLRSAQPDVGISDLFWYFLMPGADVHQEHVESGKQHL